MQQVLVGADGSARGVVLQDGTEVHSKVVLSNATPYLTFKHLAPQVINTWSAMFYDVYQSFHCSAVNHCVLL